MSIQTIQQAFFDNVYGNDATTLQTLIQSQPHFTANQRTAVYYTNTHESLKETLSNTYPVCEALVGKDYFAQLATHHVKQKASKARNLNLYGEDFTDTLAALVITHKELRHLDYLPAVAELEWLLHRTYYAKNRTAFDFTALVKLTTEQQHALCFTLADDIQLMDTPFAALAIWQAHQDKTFSFDIQNVQHAPSFIVIQRKRFSPDAVLVDKNTYALLTAIQAGKTISEFTALIDDAANLLSKLIKKQWIAAFYV